MKKESFVIYKDFYEPIKELTDKELGALFRTIFEFQIHGEDIKVQNDIKLPFLFFKNQFRIDDLKYQKRVEANRENGKRGGRPTESERTHSDNSKPKKGDKILLREDKERKENEKKNEKKKENSSVVLPFMSERFSESWSLWKEYQNTQFRFKYKSNLSEQTSLKRLNELSGEDESRALLIMEQSIGNGWRGFFALKNEKKNQGSGIDETYINELKSRLQ